MREGSKAEQEGSGRAMLVERRLGATGVVRYAEGGAHTCIFGKEVGPIAVTKPKEPDGDDRLRNGDGTTDELGHDPSFLVAMDHQGHQNRKGKGRGKADGSPTKRKTCLDWGLP